MNYYFFYNGEPYLMHHGVKGMKWGVRHDPERSLVSRYKKASGQYMSNRLQNIRNSDRVNYMSTRQKQSLANAQKYWNARAAGKQTPNRNIIKRYSDITRSPSLKARAGMNVANGILNGVSYNLQASIHGLPKKAAGQIAVQSMSGTASNMLVDEIVNKAFGHY